VQIVKRKCFIHLSLDLGSKLFICAVLSAMDIQPGTERFPNTQEADQLAESFSRISIELGKRAASSPYISKAAAGVYKRRCTIA
jgi:hypothetical protein